MKIVRLLLNAGAGIKAKSSFMINEKAHQIYKNAGSAKTVLVETLLKDAYTDERYSVLFDSKRLNKNIAINTAFDIYIDAKRNKNVLLEGLLLEAETNPKYAVFFGSLEDVPVDQITENKEIVFNDDEELSFPMLENESSDDNLNGW